MPVHWYVDLDAERVDVHLLREGRYGTPRSLDGSAALELDGAPRLGLRVSDVFAG